MLSFFQEELFITLAEQARELELTPVQHKVPAFLGTEHFSAKNRLRVAKYRRNRSSVLTRDAFTQAVADDIRTVAQDSLPPIYYEDESSENDLQLELLKKLKRQVNDIKNRLVLLHKQKKLSKKQSERLKAHIKRVQVLVKKKEKELS